MNHRTWMLAVGGSLSFACLVGFAGDSEWMEAEDDLSSLREVAPPVPDDEQSGRDTKRAESRKPTPNYYDKLFSEDQPTAANKKKKGPLPASAPRRDVIDPEQQEPPKPAIKPGRSRIPPKTEKQPVTTHRRPSGESSSPAVIKAELDHALDKSLTQPIQQTRVETRAKAPHVPPPSNRSRNSAVNLIAPQQQSSSTGSSQPHVTGPQQTSITLEWVKKSDFNVGQESQVELVVKNTGSSPADHLVVEAVFQTPLRLVSTQPKATENRERLSWKLDRLAPGAEQRLALTLIPGRRGDLGVQAEVRCTGTASARFRVEEPLLNIAVNGPTEVMLGDSASQTVVVTNPGTGAAHDVKISTRLSKGLEFPRGEAAAADMEIGTISPGESRTVRLPLAALHGGPQTITVTASSSSDISSDATATIKVVSPSLKLQAEGPALRYKGRSARFTAQVTNDGSVANNNVRVTQAVAEGFQFVSADHGGKYEPSQKTISWFLGRLEPGQSIQVACELLPAELGEFSQKFQVVSDAGAKAESVVETQIDGAPKLTMEVVDIDDPVEVGVETAFEIRLKNSGTKAATHVTVSCELPDGMQLLSSTGPTDASSKTRNLVFKPLTQLVPGQDVVYRVQVKGIEEDNQRIKVRVSSDSITEPLLQEETTRFYSDERRRAK
ncbi:MAG: hypothetical protein U0872_05145 [Planctomycetaceae bacterium]